MAEQKNILDAIAREVVVFDGAMGTTLQRMQLAGDLTVKDFDGRQGCNEVLSLTRPDVVAGVHRSYLEVGCDVVETNSFGASRPKLDEFDLGAKVAEVNRSAARIAREEADRAQRADGRPRFVAGSLGPSGFLPSSSDPDLGRVGPNELVEIFREQSVPLLQGGVDCLIAETAQDLLELRSQIFGARRAMQETGRSVPVIAQITLDPSGRMLLGTEPLSAAAMIAACGADVMGLNCSTGPREMVDPLRALAEHVPLPLSCQPNAGIPENRVDALSANPMQASEMINRTPFSPRSFRCLRKPDQPALSSFAPSTMPRRQSPPAATMSSSRMQAS